MGSHHSPARNLPRVAQIAQPRDGGLISAPSMLGPLGLLAPAKRGPASEPLSEGLFPWVLHGQHLPDTQVSAQMALSHARHTILFKSPASSVSPDPSLVYGFVNFFIFSLT